MQEFLSDFKMGLISAVRREFPAVSHKGCYFHHTQAIFRMVQRNGLVGFYRDSTEFQTSLRSLMALGFLPLDRVVKAFQNLRVRGPLELNPIFEYYNEFWISKIGINMYNVNGRFHRTNNALESWHSRFNKSWSEEPILNIFILIQFLISEQVSTDSLITNLSYDRPVTYTPKRVTRIEKLILRHTTRFSEGLINEQTFLAAIGHCLHTGLRVDFSGKY